MQERCNACTLQYNATSHGLVWSGRFRFDVVVVVVIQLDRFRHAIVAKTSSKSNNNHKVVAGYVKIYTFDVLRRAYFDSCL